jgi:phage regulator Rha-like protein
MPTIKSLTIPSERIVNQIHVIRGKKVMLDRDIAQLYGVETRTLTQAVRRNKNRFPDEFMFHLNGEEFSNLKSQIVISSWGGSRKPPLAFTEQGVAMLSAVLHSKKAVAISILIIKAFVRMRELLETNEVLRAKLAAMEQQLGSHSKQIREVYSLLRRLIDEPVKPKNQIGFKSPKGRSGK